MDIQNRRILGKNVDILSGKYAGTSGKVYDSRKNEQTSQVEYEVRAGSELLDWLPQADIKLRPR